MKQNKRKLALRGGAYSMALTAMLLAVLVLVNVLVQLLPASMTKFDISAAKLYSVTSNTKNVVGNLEQDVTIYWISQPDQEDEILRNLLDRYASLSDHIRIVRRNPDIYPAFAEAYTDETVTNNSLVVESGTRSRYIPFQDIYLAQPDPNTYSYCASFDGEGAITSAIDYCVNEEQPVLYQLEGHGELPLPEVFLDQLTKANMELETLSLLTADEIPEDCAALLIHGPSSDISEEEQSMLEAYTNAGGKLLVLAGPTPEGMLPNLYGILEHHGITTREGVIVEQDRAHFAFGTPYVLLPAVESSAITDPLIGEHYYPIVPIAQGLTVAPEAAGVQTLLQTTASSFNQPEGFGMQDYEKPENAEEGPFALAVCVDTGSEGQIVWYASSLFLDPLYNAYSSGANVDMVLNTLTQLVGERETLAIRSKSLNYNYLTISESTASMLKILLIGIFPLTCLGVGVAVVAAGRKERRHETA